MDSPSLLFPVLCLLRSLRSLYLVFAQPDTYAASPLRADPKPTANYT